MQTIQIYDKSTELGKKYIARCCSSPGFFLSFLEEMKTKKIRYIVLNDHSKCYLINSNVRRAIINSENIKFNLYILNTLLEYSHNE